MDYRICFVTYGLQMYVLLLFDHEVPLVVQGIALIRASKKYQDVSNTYGNLGLNKA